MSSETAATWPNIALLNGRLFGLGLSIRLPDDTQVVDLAGATRAVGGRQARLLTPCVGTQAKDREWLEAQKSRGMQPAMVAEELLLLPTAANNAVEGEKIAA
jgi:hypothetical protein